MENKDVVVKLLMVPTGPIIAEVVAENELQIVTNNPCQIISDEQGGLAVVDYLDYLADHTKPTIFSRNAVISMNDANPALIKEYLDIIGKSKSKLFVPDNKIII